MCFQRVLHPLINNPPSNTKGILNAEWNKSNVIRQIAKNASSKLLGFTEIDSLKQVSKNFPSLPTVKKKVPTYILCANFLSEIKGPCLLGASFQDHCLSTRASPAATTLM